MVDRTTTHRPFDELYRRWLAKIDLAGLAHLSEQERAEVLRIIRDVCYREWLQRGDEPRREARHGLLREDERSRL
jgi:hypothetical protein